MTIRNLEIFVEVCASMNMSKAAQNLMISQSSVSQAVAALEKEYDVLLFERLNRTLYLTAAGKQMLFLARQALQNLDQLRMKMQDASFQQSLRVGACTTIASCLIHPLLACYRARFPEARVLVEMNNSKALEKRLLAAKLDLAIVQRTKLSPFLDAIPLLEDHLIIICRPDHPLAGQTVPLRALEGEIFVSREKGSGTGLLLERAFLKRGLSLQTGWSCNSIDSVRQAVLHGAGVAAISHYLVNTGETPAPFGVIHISDASFRREFDLVYHKDKIHDEPFRQFVETCTQLGKEGMRRLIGGEK